eukprot:SAG11_NODE_25_length_23789_cov_23.813592_2_plen_43_part_00
MGTNLARMYEYLYHIGRYYFLYYSSILVPLIDCRYTLNLNQR